MKRPKNPWLLLLLAAPAAQLCALPARAGNIYENRQDDRERNKLEKAEVFSQRGAFASTPDRGAQRADRPFQGSGKNASTSGRAGVQIVDSPYRPTVRQGPISTGGPVRAPWVSNCPNAGFPCANVTPYQPPMDRILKGIKDALRKLKAVAVLMRTKFGLIGLGLLGMTMFLTITRIGELILRFAARTDQKAQGRLLKATAKEILILANDLRTGKNVSPSQIEARTFRAGKKARKEIDDRLKKPKEL